MCIYAGPKTGKVDVSLEIPVFTREDAGAGSSCKLLGAEPVQDSGVPTLNSLWTICLPMVCTPLQEKHPDVHLLGLRLAEYWAVRF